MPQNVGRITLTVNGRVLNTKPGPSVDPGGPTRTSETSDQSVGWSGKLRPSMVKCEVVNDAGITLSFLASIEAATVQYRDDLGRSMIIENAFQTGELEAKAGDNGGIPLTLEGPPATEQGGA